MASPFIRHKYRTALPSPGTPRRRPAALAHLIGMTTPASTQLEIPLARTGSDTAPRAARSIPAAADVPAVGLAQQILTLAEPHVPVQTIYDLRTQGRGPRGFRVGRQLRFRLSEIDAWLSWLESQDEHRDPSGQS